MAKLSPELLDLYRKTVIEVYLKDGTFMASADPSVESLVLPPPLQPYFWVITPCNPESKRLSSAENQARFQSFWSEAQARSERPGGVSCFRAVGRSTEGAWREQSVAFVGLDQDAAVALAISHEQNALFWVGEAGARIVSALKAV
jgi:hypothetical protein